MQKHIAVASARQASTVDLGLFMRSWGLRPFCLIVDYASENENGIHLRRPKSKGAFTEY